MAVTMTASDYDRLLKTCLREVEVEIVALVERAFERVPADTPVDDQILPWIGSWPYICTRAEQKQLVVRALLARQWFRYQAAPWAQPLPLTADDCYAMFNGPHQGNLRSRLRGEYGLMLRGRSWNLEHVTPFEVF